MQLKELVRSRWKEHGIDYDKVRKTVSSYLRIARDNHLNYNELQKALAIVKGTMIQSLNSADISVLPDTTVDVAKE
ncbi:MAG: hypothetical protein NC541_14775 [bacterium]|nr:hypothetical protein [bacterium]